MAIPESPSPAEQGSGPASSGAADAPQLARLSRRSMLRGSAAVAAFGLTALLDACSSSSGGGASSSSSSSASSSGSSSSSASSASSSSASSSSGGSGSSGAVASSGGGSASSSAPAKNVGTISFGSNYSDAAPKAAFAALCAAATATGVSVEHQHGRPQHVPEQHHQLPAGHAATTCSPGSPATACSTSPRRGWSSRSTTCGRRSAATSPTRSKTLSKGHGRPLLLRADLQLPVGGLLQQEHVRAEGLHRPDHLGRLHHAVQEDEDRRHDPARLRRQGRLAGAGHVRHPQHADQRLRLPHQADEAPDPVDRPGCHRRCSTSGPS